MTRENQRAGVPGRGSRAPYQRPKLRIIELGAEETLQESCKQDDSGSAPTGFTCTSNNCGKAGS